MKREFFFLISSLWLGQVWWLNRLSFNLVALACSNQGCNIAKQRKSYKVFGNGNKWNIDLTDDEVWICFTLRNEASKKKKKPLLNRRTRRDEKTGSVIEDKE